MVVSGGSWTVWLHGAGRKREDPRSPENRNLGPDPAPSRVRLGFCQWGSSAPPQLPWSPSHSLSRFHNEPSRFHNEPICLSSSGAASAASSCWLPPRCPERLGNSCKAAGVAASGEQTPWTIVPSNPGFVSFPLCATLGETSKFFRPQFPHL